MHLEAWSIAAIITASFMTAITVVLVRLFQPQMPRTGTGPVRTMIVLGSGGHTAEMLMLLDNLDKKLYAPRIYVVAETDAMSGKKASSREADCKPKVMLAKYPSLDDGTAQTAFEVAVIPRSREVGQSYVSSVGTTLYSLWSASALVWRQKPELVLVNGPGTCIPICVAATAYRLLGLQPCYIVYVESIARTQRFSLSAKLLYYGRMADLLLVQWEQLQRAYPRSVYAGRLY